MEGFHQGNDARDVGRGHGSTRLELIAWVDNPVLFSVGRQDQVWLRVTVQIWGVIPTGGCDVDGAPKVRVARKAIVDGGRRDADHALVGGGKIRDAAALVARRGNDYAPRGLGFEESLFFAQGASGSA